MQRTCLQIRSHCELSSGHEFQETLFNPLQPPTRSHTTITSMLLPRHDQELIFFFYFFLNVIYSCYICLSLISLATCLVHHFIFLTCLSASEGICQIPLYSMHIVTGLCTSYEEVPPLSSWHCMDFTLCLIRDGAHLHVCLRRECCM